MSDAKPYTAEEAREWAADHERCAAAQGDDSESRERFERAAATMRKYAEMVESATEPWAPATARWVEGKGLQITRNAAPTPPPASAPDAREGLCKRLDCHRWARLGFGSDWCCVLCESGSTEHAPYCRRATVAPVAVIADPPLIDTEQFGGSDFEPPRIDPAEYEAMGAELRAQKRAVEAHPPLATEPATEAPITCMACNDHDQILQVEHTYEAGCQHYTMLAALHEHAKLPKAPEVCAREGCGDNETHWRHHHNPHPRVPSCRLAAGHPPTSLCHPYVPPTPPPAAHVCCDPNNQGEDQHPCDCECHWHCKVCGGPTPCAPHDEPSAQTCRRYADPEDINSDELCGEPLPCAKHPAPPASVPAPCDISPDAIALAVMGMLNTLHWLNGHDAITSPTLQNMIGEAVKQFDRPELRGEMVRLLYSEQKLPPVTPAPDAELEAFEEWFYGEGRARRGGYVDRKMKWYVHAGWRAGRAYERAESMTATEQIRRLEETLDEITEKSLERKARIAELESEQQALRDLQSSKAPCGHYATFTHSEDPKHAVMFCTLCRIAELERALAGQKWDDMNSGCLP